MTRASFLLRSRGVAAAVALVVSSVTPSCATADAAALPGKLAADREELARLKRDIAKVDKSIAVTRELLLRSKGERYLPDLYFRLAELQIEKSRLVYFRILEEAGADDKAAVVAPEARLLKQQAIGTYRRILAEFPDYVDNDKVTFFIAHEYRELGDYTEMLKTYEELVKKYPKSNFRFESWLILGDYQFDKGAIDEAAENYRLILKNQETYAHNMARYKLGWCLINKDKIPQAVDLFEQALKTPTLAEPGIEQRDSLTGRPPRLDVRQDALRDLAYYYADARDARTAIAFFENLTQSRAEYRMTLEKLARRFQVKTMFDDAAKVYRELVRISHDVERNLEWAEAIYEAAVAAKDLQHADEDVVMLAEVAARYKYWWRADDDDKKVLADFEMLARDLSTRLHAYAREKNDDELHRRAARAYERYLSVFDDAPERLNMQWNHAEALFAAKDFVKAGRAYEKVLKLLNEQPTTSAGATKTAQAQAAAVPMPDAKASENGEKKPGPRGDAKADAKADAKVDAKKKTPTPGERLVTTTGDVEGDRKQAMYAAILSYFEAIKSEEKSTRFASMLAREGMKDLGGRFVQKYPDDANTPQVKFNVARAWFEQGLFDKSIELFAAFASEYPTNKDSVTAGELVLDAFAQKEDFSGLAKQARAFAADARLDAAFRDRAAKLAEQAEQEEINRKTIAAEGNVAAALASFVVEKKGSEVAAKALAQAFIIARDRRNVGEMQKIGRQLLDEYGNTKFAIEVLPGLADMAVRTSQLEAAAGYYEEQARRFPDDGASDTLLENAASIRAELGEFTGAMSDYERLTKQGDENKRATWFAQLARQAARAGDWRRAEDAALAVVDNGAYAVVGNTIAGEAALRTGKPEVAIERLGSALTAKARGIDDADMWLARAQYLLGEVVRANYERVSLTGGADDGNVLQQKFQLLDELEGAYVAAIQQGDPEWAMGGLYRIANAYKQAAEFLESAPIPAGTAPADEKALKKALGERAAPLKKKGQEALETCRVQAKKLEAFNRFSRACLAGTAVDDDGDNLRARPANVAIPGREALEQKLVENPKDLTSLLQLVRAAIQVKDHPLARLLALRAIEIDDRNADALNLLGVASFQSNQAQAAADAFKRALKVNGRHPQALANLGVMWGTWGDADRARDFAGKAGVVDPTSPDVLPGPKGGGAR